MPPTPITLSPYFSTSAADVAGLVCAAEAAGRSVSVIFGLHPSRVAARLPPDFTDLAHLAPFGEHKGPAVVLFEGDRVPTGIPPSNVVATRATLAELIGAVGHPFASEAITFGAHAADALDRSMLLGLAGLLTGMLRVYLLASDGGLGATRKKSREAGAVSQRTRQLAGRLEKCGYEDVKTATILPDDPSPVPGWPRRFESLVTARVQPIGPAEKKLFALHGVPGRVDRRRDVVRHLARCYFNLDLPHSHYGLWRWMSGITDRDFDCLHRKHEADLVDILESHLGKATTTYNLPGKPPSQRTVYLPKADAVTTIVQGLLKKPNAAVLSEAGLWKLLQDETGVPTALLKENFGDVVGPTIKSHAVQAGRREKSSGPKPMTPLPSPKEILGHCGAFAAGKETFSASDLWKYLKDETKVSLERLLEHFRIHVQKFLWENFGRLEPKMQKALRSYLADKQTLSALRAMGFEPPFEYLPPGEKILRIRNVLGKALEAKTEPISALKMTKTLLEILKTGRIMINENALVMTLPQIADILWAAADGGVIEKSFLSYHRIPKPGPATGGGLTRSKPKPAAPARPPSAIGVPSSWVNERDGYLRRGRGRGRGDRR